MGRLTRKVKHEEEINLLLEKIQKKYPNAKVISVNQDQLPSSVLNYFNKKIAAAFAISTIVFLIIAPPLSLASAYVGCFYSRFVPSVKEYIIIKDIFAAMSIKGKPLALRFKIANKKIEKMWIFYT